MPASIPLSLTDFIDFATRAGTPRLSKVREIWRRGDYSPATDFWRPFREHLQNNLKAGTLTTQSLRAFAGTYRDGKKVRRFSAAAMGYARFIGRKDCEWFDPPQSVWTPQRLRVRINPEIGLRIDGRAYVIKLYFKDSPLTKLRVDLLTFLLRKQLSPGQEGLTFGVLDVAKAKLYPAADPSQDLMPLLLGEAASFVAIYDSLESKAA